MIYYSEQEYRMVHPLELHIDKIRIPLIVPQK